MDRKIFILADRPLPRPHSVEPFFQTHQIPIPEVYYDFFFLFDFLNT
jgi:hypothetical protein